MPLLSFAATMLMNLPTNLEYNKKENGGVSTYKKGVYCGPGWGYTYRDILDGKIKTMPAAVDAIDNACKAHDECYAEHGYFTQGCNLVLTVDLVKVVTSADSTPQQRADAAIMAAIFFIESQTIDLGKMSKQQYDAMRDRIVGYMGQSANTLEQAIQRELMRGR
ncbi:hypothetical protein [Methylobacterium dankookense]|uniref:Phospholipase A2 domain-containing protein n=1 Tax=Methylobacterium dankookense TaxID=560405 RepID=A0A564FUJ2_9HYPH|nr:hypothetical protein [Methylobacterium dankookense]GJD56739.1 hypothetical protein IFDJLNFL_2636 [Methylobacterium dankookense]VUF11753.1 hypothetical protein MTDSW087_01437 [Methylobacterium dankookense]